MGLRLWGRHLGSLPQRQCVPRALRNSDLLLTDPKVSWVVKENSKANQLFRMFPFNKYQMLLEKQQQKETCWILFFSLASKH